MSRSDPDGPSTDAETEMPKGIPFTTERAKKAVDGAWRAKREEVLKEHGLWSGWRCVPPKKDRKKPLEAYLPGGEEYE